MKLLDIKETQGFALNILKYISKICEEQNITYFLMWGTLIGAIRHNGFIPWDDDIDICMPRSDYNRFIDYFESVSTGRYQLYRRGKTLNYYFSLPRIIDTETIILGERKDNIEQKDCGIFVDIYPLDYVGDTREECKKFFKTQMRYEWLKGLAQQKQFVKSKSNYLNTFVKIPFYIYAKIKGGEFFYQKMEKHANAKHSDSALFCCSCYGTGGMNIDKLIFPSSLFEEGLNQSFEGFLFKIPNGYDEILTQIYGDYLQLPPVEDRVGHHEYKAYKL